MNRLLTYAYQGHQNYVVTQCTECRKIKTTPITDDLTLSCCSKDQIDKLPIHYLINSTMFIYSLYNKKRDKEYIGVTMQGAKGSQKYMMRIINKDIEDIIFYNENLDLIADIREDGMDNFDIEILKIVTKLSTARIEEELQVMMRGTMEPKGYNQSLKVKGILEKL